MTSRKPNCSSRAKVLSPIIIFWVAAPKQIKPITRLAARIRTKEMSISLLLKACSFFCKTWYRIKAVIIPEIEVAKARPLNFIGNISAALSTIFITKETADTFAGVSVSLRAKKQDCRILVVPYAVRPTL